MYNKIIKILFNLVIISYISSFFETDEIISLYNLKNININTISNITLEKFKNYGLIEY